MKLYYIQNGYSGNAIMWWGIDSKGYTTDLRKAGKYTKEQAKLIITRPEDTAWSCDYIDKCTESHKIIVDGQYLKANSKRRMVGKRR